MADLFDVVVARKLSGGGGGGGSSDFSTAIMTMVDESEIGAEMYGAFADTNPQYTMQSYGLSYTESNEFTVLMYSNQAEVQIKDGYRYNIVCTGNATVDGSGYITITGDCTVTIS